MSFVIGLTGSIGMGKSTTAKMFADEGVPIWDADKTVVDLYAPNGPAVEAVRQIYPAAIQKDAVSRPILREAISSDPSILDRLNDAVHPMVQKDRAAFLKQHADQLVLLDIPLLFETGADKECDFVAVVSVPENIQRERVLARGEMTEADLQIILERQMPDADKRAKADLVIETFDMDDTRKAVRKLVQDLRHRMKHA